MGRSVYSRISGVKGCEEVSRTRDEMGHTFLVYDVWTFGGLGDPAATVERWVAVFLPENESSYTDVDTLLRNKQGRYPTYFSGPENADVNNMLCTIQEEDSAAKTAAHDQEMLEYDEKEDDRGRGKNTEQKSYELFWEAVDIYSKDPTNKDAWRAIQMWRARQLRSEDRQAFIGGGV